MSSLNYLSPRFLVKRSGSLCVVHCINHKAEILNPLVLENVTNSSAFKVELCRHIFDKAHQSVSHMHAEDARRTTKPKSSSLTHMFG